MKRERERDRDREREERERERVREREMERTKREKWGERNIRGVDIIILYSIFSSVVAMS